MKKVGVVLFARPFLAAGQVMKNWRILKEEAAIGSLAGLIRLDWLVSSIAVAMKTVFFAQPILVVVRAIHRSKILENGEVPIGMLADREYPISVPHLKITGNSAMSIVVAILKTVPFAQPILVVVRAIHQFSLLQEKAGIGMPAHHGSLILK